MNVKVVLSLLAGLFGAACVLAEDLPVEYFFKDPTYRSVKLSPEGTHIAVLVRYDNIMNLAVIDLATNKPAVITLEKQDISWFAWVNNERLIYSMDKVTDVSFRRTGGLFAVNRDGEKARVLVVPPGGDDSISVWNLAIPRYIGPDPGSDRRILVSIGERSRRYPDVYSMDAYTGRKTRVLINDWNARYYSADVDDNIRFAFQTEVVGKTTVHFLNPETGKWEILTTLPQTDANWLPLDFSPTRDTFLVATDLEDSRGTLVRYNWKERRSEPAFEDPPYDIDPESILLEIKKQDRVVGVYYEADKPKVHYFDEEHAKLQAMIDQVLPDTFNQIIGSDDKGDMLLISAASDRQMPTYCLLYLKTYKLDVLTNIAPWIHPEELTERRPITFTASDGVKVHGYLTLPQDFEEGQPVPLILHPHGGPWARDVWRLRWYGDNDPHFYANRGFAVLQVNFRGSTGYGNQFFNQHIRNIERMFLDVVEAAEWAVDEGFAHPDRIGIAGASWGGYKTMLCLVKRPGMFKFGINMFGVVDLNEHVLTYLEWNRWEAYDYWVQKFWDPKDTEGAAKLAEWSPITHIDQIKGKVFVYHGVRDANVDIEQSRMLISALSRLNHPHEKIIDSDEMHSMENEKLRLRIYRKVDAFLMPFRKEWGLVD